MHLTSSKFKLLLATSLLSAAFSTASQTVTVLLSGTQEVPAVATTASGAGTIKISPDQSISGSVTTTGVEATMAHIHMAASGQNGPVIVPMTKTAENVWSIPAGSKLSDTQFQNFKDGNLYVNVHTATNKGGEIRAQIKP